MLARVSFRFTTTTKPGTGGNRRTVPAWRGSLRPGFDHVISRNGILNAEAIDWSVSPALTVYMKGLRLGSVPVGMEIGLRIVLLRPIDMSPTAPPETSALAARALMAPAGDGTEPDSL